MVSAPVIDRVRAALAALTDDQLDAAVHALGDGEHLGSLAQALNLKRPALHAHPTPSELVRPRLAHAAPGRLAYTALALAGPCSDECIDALGDHADDPAKDDMERVLPELLEHHDAAIVTLMLTAYPAIDAPCRAVFEDLLDTDPRFEIGPPAATKWTTAVSIVEVDESAVERARKERDARIKAEAAKRKKRKR
jgi:hypothetical protein